MNVLVDTTAWYAYFVRSDRFHTQAVNYFSTNPSIYTNSAVIEETLALLHHRVGKHETIIAARLMFNMCGDSISYTTAQDDENIIKFYTIAPAYIDYVDASLVWLSRKLDIPVFTFDAHFRTMKVAIVP